MKVLIINGSPRKKGRTGIVSRFISAKYKMDLFNSGLLPLFNGEEEQNSIKEVKQLKELVKEVDGIVLTSPDYHNGMSGALKNLLDFLSSEQMKHKPVALLACAGGGKGGINPLNNMRTVARGLYSNVIPKQLVLDPVHLDKEKETLSSEGEKMVDDLIQELYYYVRMHSLMKKA